MGELTSILLLNGPLKNANILGLGYLDSESVGWIIFDEKAVDREKIPWIMSHYMLSRS